MDATTKEAKKVKLDLGTVTRAASTTQYKIASTSAAVSAGGLFYATSGFSTFSDLELYGTLTTSSPLYVAVLVANSYNGGTCNITNVDNYATLVSSKGTHVGSLIGISGAATITNCHNYAPISGVSAGGLVGTSQGGVETFTVTGCSNGAGAAITGTTSAGGLVNSLYGKVKKSYNLGAITGGSYAGGIIGRAYNNKYTGYIDECWNAGAVTITKNDATAGAGGIAGITDTNTSKTRHISITNCFNLGAITGGELALVGAAIGSPFAGTCTINGFYDLVNSDLGLYGNAGTSASNSYTFSYILGDGTSTSNYSYVNNNTMKTLTTTVVENSPFNDGKIWKMAEGYSYPQLVSAPYVGEDYVYIDPNANYHEVMGITGSGTEADPYIIDTADKLRAIFAILHTDHLDGVMGTAESKVYYLQTADIDVSSGYFVKTAQKFYGVYRGGVKEGANITYTKKDIKVAMDGGASNAAVIPQLYGEISNITVSGSIVNDANLTAGVVGTAYKGSLISNCENKATITGQNIVGGIVANLAGGTVSNCKNSGTINVNGHANAGIVGKISTAQSTVTGCVNTGAITYTFTPEGESTFSTMDGKMISGIVGWANYKAVISDCHNKGNISGEGWYQNSSTYGGIGQSIGGVLGYAEKNITVTNCSNTGNITITSAHTYKARCVAGIVGRIALSAHDLTSSVTGCWNSGAISGELDRSAGIVGEYYRKDTNATPNIVHSLSNCFNTGLVPSEGASNGAVVGILWDQEDTYDKYQFTDVYTTQGEKIVGGTTGSSGYVLTDAYMFSPAIQNDLANGTKFATKKGLAALVTNGSFDNAIWEVHGTYEVPVIKANPYTGAAIELEEAAFDKGDGSKENPFEVHTLDQFNKINELKLYASYFKQMADIGTVTVPVGEYDTNPFTGGYDGNGFKIDVNLSHNDAAIKSYGLFAHIKGAELVNITVTGEVTVGTNGIKSNGVGVIVGCAVSTGSSDKAYITSCVNKANLINDGKEPCVGAIVGRAYDEHNVISGCVNYGDVTSKTRAAGITGVINAGTTLENCINYGDMTGVETASGIASWAYDGLSDCANFGTITATSPNGTAAGIVGLLQKTDGLKISNCFNAGTLVAAETRGIAGRTISKGASATALNGDINYSLINCYNMVYATYPIAENNVRSYPDEATLKLATFENCYALTGNEAQEAVTGITFKTLPSDMAAIDLGSAFSVKAGFDYPQLTALTFDATELSKVSFAKVTTTISNSEGSDDKWGSFMFKNFTLDTPFYVRKGFTGLQVVVNPSDNFYKASVSVNGTPVKEDIINDSATVSVDISDDTAIVIYVEKVVSNKEDLPAIETINDIKPIHTATAQEFNGLSFTKYALIAGKAPVKFGFNLNEYGVIIGHSDKISVDYENSLNARPYTFKATITDANKKNDAGKYGTLIYGDNLEAGATYYVRAYAMYRGSDGTDYFVEGDVKTFTIPAEAVAESEVE